MEQTLFDAGDAAGPGPLIESVQELVVRGDSEITSVQLSRHSNDLAAVSFDDGRTLMIKRGRYDWVAARFANSRVAAELLRERAGVVAPQPLELPEDLDERPLEVYWRVELPTLSDLWEDLSDAERTSALRSWGEMLRRVHSVTLQGWGTLVDGAPHETLADYLRSDLEERLFPAVAGEWEQAAPYVATLVGWIEEVAGRVNGRGAVLAHNDVHAGNVMCDPRGPRCVGLIDLEATVAGPAEADLAIAEVLHGPLFNQPLPPGWLPVVMEGYGSAPDPVVLRFFRAYHLANLGFFSALVGDVEHAAAVAERLRDEVEGMHLG